MTDNVTSVVAVLPARDIAQSLAWWTGVCGFAEVFRYGEPPGYAGIARGGARLHFALVDDAALARTVGEQTMVRIIVEDVEAMYADYQQRGGVVHPNGPLETKPWGSSEFAAIDPNGVCVSFSS